MTSAAAYDRHNLHHATYNTHATYIFRTCGIGLGHGTHECEALAEMDIVTAATVVVAATMATVAAAAVVAVATVASRCAQPCRQLVAGNVQQAA